MKHLFVFNTHLMMIMDVSFRSPDIFYLLTVGVEVVHFHLITLRHTPHSVGLLWTRDRPGAETSTWQHKQSQETNIHTPGWIRTHDPSKLSASDLRLRPRSHWDQHFGYINVQCLLRQEVICHLELQLFYTTAFPIMTLLCTTLDEPLAASSWLQCCRCSEWYFFMWDILHTRKAFDRQ
jgi:hypothetical protein